MTVDQLLRQGAVTEIVGPLCSGRTSLLAACLREVARAGGAAALIDADDAFDPVSAARAGVDLSRVLWVRCGGWRDAARRRVLGAGATLVVETRRCGLAWAGPRLTPTRLAGAETAVSVLRRQGAEAGCGGVMAWSA